MTIKENNGKVAVITGAGTGIGKSAVLHLIQDGYQVVLAGRRDQPLIDTAQESGAGEDRFLIQTTDVSKEEDVKKLFNVTMKKFQRVDVLFNNAGIGVKSTTEDLSLSDWQRVIDINLTGSFLCAKEAIQIMKNQNPLGGRIINNGSISAYVPRPDSVAYTSTKHAISGLTKQISLDGRKYNIACSQIDVGNAATPMTATSDSGQPQPNGDVVPEPRFNVSHVGESILQISNLPLDTNIQFMTIMATKMPYVGRG